MDYKDIRDENNKEVSPLDDDYFAYKKAWEDEHNPLSDDYNKYAEYESD